MAYDVGLGFRLLEFEDQFVRLGYRVHGVCGPLSDLKLPKWEFPKIRGTLGFL